MSKRLQHPKGPANMKPAFSVAVLQDDKPSLKQFQGFTGFNGWKLHPTRGWKKMEGFIATTKTEVLKLYATSKPSEDEINAELASLLSESIDEVEGC
jgi:hypothetical protein